MLKTRHLWLELQASIKSRSETFISENKINQACDLFWRTFGGGSSAKMDLKISKNQKSINSR